MRNFIIGAGGVGSWLLPKLMRVAGIIYVVDGDSLEEKNLDRQLFLPEDIGDNKANALVDCYNRFRHGHAIMRSVPQFYHSGMSADIGVTSDSWLFCCADNHAARRAVLTTCDQVGCSGIIAANETTDSEAYVYLPTWRDGPNDPRTYYPIILEDNTGDPLGPAGCTGEAAEETPQLSIANDMASSLAMSLYWFWTRTRKELDIETAEFWPTRHAATAYKVTTTKLGDRK